MSDPVERGKAMLRTIGYAKARGIGQAYPDSSVAEVVGALVAEVERLRQHRTITTVEQLDALPGGAVIRAVHGEVYEFAPSVDDDEPVWWLYGDQYKPREFDLPATLLWLPEWGNK